jgi:hypothetical protein
VINHLKPVLNVKDQFIGSFQEELGLYLKDLVFIQPITRKKVIVIHAVVRVIPAVIPRGVVKSNT